MVPRMISTMVSYEVECRTVGNRDTVDTQEQEDRTYFTPEKKKRHPIPQIRYARRMKEGNVQLANMSNFTLVYPSPTLAAAVDPLLNLGVGRSLDELRAETSQKIQALIDDADLSQFIVEGGDSDRWYWAAPLLLDRANEHFKNLVSTALDYDPSKDAEFGSDDDDEPDQEGAKKDHFDFLRQCFDDPGAAKLGAIPDNLAKVLADLSLGSPAVIAYRSLQRAFPSSVTATRFRQSMKIANAFVSLFNKPESIAAVRLSENHRWYWLMVADYCASGCLQSVLDEYLHLLLEQSDSSPDVVKQLCDAVNLNTSTINVDSLESFTMDDSRKMRCHYAVEFGSQRLEESSGQKRAANLREVFNSPFRPFLLSTTSIGQEGLDFHSYCRRIVHWNLPSNPVDLEQREGRINRFKSLVIRQQIAKKYRHTIAAEDLHDTTKIWDNLFAAADMEERQKAGKCELIPYWHVSADEHPKIERVIPLYPFSVDRQRLSTILKTLTIYRLAFGQPRQAELVEHLLNRNLSDEEIAHVKKTLMIDLSPISYHPPMNVPHHIKHEP